MGFGPLPGTNTLNLPATLPFSGQSTVTLTKGIAGTPGNAGELQQPVWYNPDPTDAGGNTLTLSGDTLSAINFIRHCDGHEFGAAGIVPPIPIASSSASVAGVVTVVTTYPHFLATGRDVWFFDSTDAVLNAAAQKPVTVTGSNTFTISLSGASGGTGGSFSVTQYSGTFLENSDVDGPGTAGNIWFQHSTDYGGAVGNFSHIRLLIDRIGGAFHLLDRNASDFLTNSADGSTLTFGLGGNVTAVSCRANLQFGSGKIIQLDAAGAVGISNPKIQFGTNGTGSGFATTNGGDLLVGVNDGGTGLFTLAATFGRDESLTMVGAINSGSNVTGTGLSAVQSGNAGCSFQSTSAGSGKKWLTQMETDGNLYFVYFDGSSFHNWFIQDGSGNVTVGGGITIGSGAALKLGNAATTGLTPGVLAATTNASIVLTDSNGQAYRIPCII